MSSKAPEAYVKIGGVTYVYKKSYYVCSSCKSRLKLFNDASKFGFEIISPHTAQECLDSHQEFLKHFKPMDAKSIMLQSITYETKENMPPPGKPTAEKTRKAGPSEHPMATEDEGGRRHFLRSATGKQNTMPVPPLPSRESTAPKLSSSRKLQPVASNAVTEQRYDLRSGASKKNVTFGTVSTMSGHR